MVLNIRLTNYANTARLLVPWAAISFLLLAFRAAQRFLSGGHSLTGLLSIGTLFGSAIWLLLFPLIVYTNARFDFHKLGWQKFFAWHLLFAILFGIAHSYLFFYMHGWIWPGVLSADNLSALTLVVDLKLNFFVYWLLLGGLYGFRAVRNAPPAQELSVMENVVFIKAMGNYVVVNRMVEGKLATEIIRKSMSNIQGDFTEDRFMRVHRSFLVNREHIRSFSKEAHGTYRLVLTTGHEIPSSREKKEEVRLWLTQDSSSRS